MKKVDIENVLNNLNNIKKIIDKENYNLSTAVNKELIKVIPVLQKEYERLDTDKLDITCPALLLLTQDEAEKENKTIVEYLNYKIKDLVMKEYKIIDFGLCKNFNNIEAYIKYTS